MKCSNCSKEAITEVKWKKKFYCTEHFTQYFFGQIRKALENKKYKTTEKEIKRDTKVWVAVSGGKDSNVCVYVLKKLGYNVSAFHLKLDIPEFTQDSIEKISELEKFLNTEIKIIDLKKEIGFSMQEILKKHKNRAACKVCGTIKRYLFNKLAFENGFEYVATGHNLSDAVAHGLNTLFNNYFTDFKNIFPILPPEKELKLCGRVKPLFFLTDEEIKLFAQIHKIPFLEKKCPYTSDNPLVHQFKKSLNALEKERPGVLRRLCFGFIELAKIFEKRFEEQKKDSRCKICGYPSLSKKCYFCKLIYKK